MRSFLLPALASVSLAACTTTAEVDVIAVHSELGPEHQAGLFLATAIEGAERALFVRLNGQLLAFEGDPNPVVAWTRGGLGFTLPTGGYVVELEDESGDTLLRTPLIPVSPGSNHVVAFGDDAALRHVAGQDVPVLSESVTRGGVTNALRDQGPLDVFTCPPGAAPPDAACSLVSEALAYGATWEEEMPRGDLVFARATRPDVTATFRFTPDHRFNGAPEDETPCTATTRGSLIALGWSDAACDDPWSDGALCLDALEAHDNTFGSYDDPHTCEAP